MSYQDSLQMTHEFAMNSENLEGIWSDFRDHVSPLFSDNDVDERGYLHVVVGAAQVLKILDLRNNFEAERLSLIRDFISKSGQKGHLTKWHLVVKTTGQAQEKIAKGKILADESGLPIDIKMGIRNGSSKGIDRDTLLDKGVFKATGRSANIMTAPDDMSVPLSAQKIEAAVASYRKFIQAKLRAENPDWSEEQLEQEVRKKARRPPERVYREALDEREGALIIYLFDTNYVFKPQGNTDDDAYQNYVKSNKLNLTRLYVRPGSKGASVSNSHISCSDFFIK